MVWLYVVTGLIIIIIMLILINIEKRKVKSGYYSDKYKHVTVYGNLNICLACGNKFRGHKCPYCGFDNININK